MASMQRMMRYNEYQTDPLSLQDASRTIVARGDLNVPWTTDPIMTGPSGGVDAKITDQKLIRDMAALAVSGPTWDSQPPFAWTRQWFPDGTIPNWGHPKCSPLVSSF